MGLASLFWEGKKLCIYNYWSSFPPKILEQPGSLAPGPGTFPWASKISSPSVFKCPLQSSASKLHINWDSIGCLLCSSEDQIGVQVGCMRKWVQLATNLPPTSNVPQLFDPLIYWWALRLFPNLAIVNCAAMNIERWTDSFELVFQDSQWNRWIKRQFYF